MKQYLELIHDILKNGVETKDRTGIGTKSIFGYQMKFNLQDGFPLVTTKKLHTKSIIHELLWFLRGDTNINYLNKNGVHIWDDWADEKGELGPIYGKQWRSWENNGIKIDQISNAIEEIKLNPFSRRIIVSSWNPTDVNKMALPPCHCLFQFNVQNDKLSCQLYQRSADVFLGIPFNIASYSLLIHMIAKITGLEVGYFIHSLGDAHLYLNHINQAEEQIKRKAKILPKLEIIGNQSNISDFRYEDFNIIGYQFHPHIAAPIAV